MKIRTRLLLFLLPTLIGGITLILMLFAYSGYTLGLFDERMQDYLVLIGLSAALTIGILVTTLYFIANKISRPVQKLNNSALAIAAGQYGESIQVDGPKEIAELANTLNTMSECLHENINRLKENSLLREKMYGEYECSILLQHLMLQKNIDQCRSDAVAIRSITFFSETPRGLLLHFPKGHDFQLHMIEADEVGLEGMYQLLTQYRQILNNDATILSLNLDGNLSYSGDAPLVWSSSNKEFISPVQLEIGDFFFLFNQGFLSLFQDPQKLLSKVLRVFAAEGIDTTVSMLQKEIGFAHKKKEPEEDIHLLCFQRLQ